MKKIYQKHGDGVQDPSLVVQSDPLFRDVLGSGVNRRDFLKISAATAAAVTSGMAAGPSFASK